MIFQKKATSPFYLMIILLVAFIDYMGIGLVYPLFASMLFDQNIHLLSPDTSKLLRGAILGFLISIMPIMQFFSAPILGTLSDQKGRKRVLLLSLAISSIGYFLAILGVVYESLVLLFFYRIIAGIASGSTAVVQAALADISHRGEKAKNFGLFNMALGIGFTIGPFLGGKLSDPNFLNIGSYALPFWFAFAIVIVNFILALAFLSESNPLSEKIPISFIAGIANLKKAMYMKGIRILILCSFIFAFGWSFFLEFAPVLLIHQYEFTAREIGNFYAYSGALYALHCGYLIRPLIQRFTSKTLLFWSFPIAGIGLLLFNAIENANYLYLYLPFVLYFIALIFPTMSAMVSNFAGKKMQGETLGILQSAQSVAFAISPLFSGTFVGLYPHLPFVFGGSSMILAGFIFGCFIFRRYLIPFFSLKE